MKHFVLFLFLLFSSASYAALTPLEEHYIEKLQSGHHTELKIISKVILKSNVRSIEVLDVAAEVLLKIYSTATNEEVEITSLLARSLGQSKNKRYYSVLKEVHENGVSEKLSRHVSIALGQLKKADGEQYARNMAALPPPKPPTSIEKELIKMLKSGDDEKIQSVANYVIYGNIYHTDLFDAAAEVLSEIYPKTSNEKNTSADLLVRLISYSYSNKYEQLFYEIHEKTEYYKFKELVRKSFRYVRVLSDK